MSVRREGSGRPRPPRVAVWVASAVLPDADREEILGDLEEAYAARWTASRARATAWYWGQILLFAWSAATGVGKMRIDLGQVTRRLVRDWRFSASIVVVLGMGMGSALVAWTVVDRILLRPLPYAEPDRLGLIRIDVGEIRDHPGVAMAEVEDMRALEETFEGVESAAAESVMTLDVDERMEPVLTARVSPGLFSLVGVEPRIGRAFTAADAEDGFAGAIVSHAFWRERLGGDPDAVGRSLRLEGRDVPILGVMPEGFALHLGTGSNVSAGVEVWLPLRIVPDHRGFWGYRTMVRLPEDVTFAAANARLEGLASALLQAWPDAYGGARLRFVAHPVHEDLLRDARSSIDTAVAGVLLLLLVSFANAASLMLGRQRAREGNLAVRSALGAGRLRLVGVVLGESLVLAVVSGAMGATLAAWAVTALRAANVPGMPRWVDLGLDARFFLAAALLTALAAVVTGLYPALKVSTATSGILRGEASTGGSSAAALRRALVGGQIALAVVLVFAGLVLGRSALRLARVELGFDPTNALTLAVPTDDDRWDETEQLWAFHGELRSRLLTLPGVVEAGPVSHLPLAGYAPTDAYSVPTADTLNWENRLANYFATAPGYLEALAVELREGRMLEDRDLHEERSVAVVDETLVEDLFPAESPLGRVIDAGWGIGELEIVGVIRHPRVMDVRTAVRPQIYVPFTVFEWMPLSYVIRAEGDAELLADAVRREVEALGAGRAVFRIRTLESYLAAATSSLRMTLMLILVQAAMTALLAAIGLFTVIAYMAYQGRRDTAIRSALGATSHDLLGQHLRSGATILAVAIPAGIVLALAGSRVLGGMVYGVAAADVASLIAAAVLTAAVGMAATYLPARGAARADPMEALRSS